MSPGAQPNAVTDEPEIGRRRNLGRISARTVGNLFFSRVAGAFGVAYLVYGRWETELLPMIPGILLCVYAEPLPSLCRAMIGSSAALTSRTSGSGLRRSF
jgi:hypothetical protein